MLKLLFPLSLVLFTSPLFGQVGTTTSALPNPIVGKAISGTVWTLSASGGTTPYTWDVSVGSLPAGVSLSPTGTITGAATSAGAATFTVRVTDSASATATKQFTITAQNAIGRGCTTATIIDWDCDYYGVGSAIGTDADDNDATINTVASWRTKFGSGPSDTSLATFRAYLTAVKAYNPNHIWYLATDGNDSTCAVDDITKPCATWASVYSKSHAGDAIVARGGTWLLSGANYSFGRGGTTAAHPDIVMGYPGENPIFDHPVAGQYGFTSDFTAWQSYIIFDGLTVQNSPCSARYSCSSTGPGLGINLSSTTIENGIVIRNNLIRYWGRDIWMIAPTNGAMIENNVLGDSRSEHNIYTGWNTNCDSAGQINLVVRGNIMFNASWDNYHNNGRSTGLVLDSNILYSANDEPSGGAPAIQFQNGTSNAIVKNNIVMYGAPSAVNIVDYYDGNTTVIQEAQTGNTFINNTFIRSGYSTNGSPGFSGDGDCVIRIQTDQTNDPNQNFATQTHPNLGGNTFQNNVLLEAAVGDWNPGSSYGCVVRYNRYSSYDAEWWTTDSYKNNIIYGMYGATPLSIGIGGGFAALPDGSWTRSWAQFASLAGAFTNNLNVNPMLAAYNPASYATPEKYYLMPSAGSPALAAGLSTGAPATDIRGNPRANPPDIGAYQYTAVTSSQGFCDLNHDGLVNSADVASAISQALGTTPCTNGDLDGNGICNVADVQRVINAVLGGSCLYH
jgi:Putative Ig domain